MPRIARIVLPGTPHHITQRGNQKQLVFFDDDDRSAYLAILRENALAYRMRILAYCLMPNHIHVVGIPATVESLAGTLGRTHFMYTARVNRKYDRHGHLWQNRFFSCPMDEAHTLNALAYVEMNPVRAGISTHAWDFTWSSAQAHCFAYSESTLMDLPRWRSYFGADGWRDSLQVTEESRSFANKIRVFTRKGRPLGDHDFQQRVADTLAMRKK